MECEHENSARCISPPPFDDTVLYWSGPKDYIALCKCVKESMCIHCSKKCGKCQNTLDEVCAVGGGFRRCLECGFVMCQGCFYDLHDQQAVINRQPVSVPTPSERATYNGLYYTTSQID